MIPLTLRAQKNCQSGNLFAPKTGVEMILVQSATGQSEEYANCHVCSLVLSNERNSAIVKRLCSLFAWTAANSTPSELGEGSLRSSTVVRPAICMNPEVMHAHQPAKSDAQSSPHINYLGFTPAAAVAPPSSAISTPQSRHPESSPFTMNSAKALSPHAARAWAHWRSLGSPRYVVAPMVDGSELAFRALCRRHGADLAYTPMLNSRIFATDPKYRAEHFTTDAKDRPVVAQFCANDPEMLIAAARLIQGDVDAIDLNLGCPQGIARRGHYGSFLQDEWDLLKRIVGRAAKELDVPIWVKIRVFPDVKKTVRYAHMLQDAGASAVAVHGRTREQKGRTAPPADWGQIKAVKEVVDVPVIANGNVRCIEDVERAIQETGADAVMSAWALLDCPAMFEGGMHSRMELAKEYLQIAKKYNTPMRMVRMHVFKMFRSRLDLNMDLNEAVAKCRSFEDFWAIVRKIEGRCDYDGESFEKRVSDGTIEAHCIVNKPSKKRKALSSEEECVPSASKENDFPRISNQVPKMEAFQDGI